MWLASPQFSGGLLARPLESVPGPGGSGAQALVLSVPAACRRRAWISSPGVKKTKAPPGVMGKADASFLFKEIHKAGDRLVGHREAGRRGPPGS